MDGQRYQRLGPFGRAVEAALREDAKHPRPPLQLCGIGGCGLAAGHQERAGTPHRPVTGGGGVAWAECTKCGHPSLVEDPQPCEAGGLCTTGLEPGR